MSLHRYLIFTFYVLFAWVLMFSHSTQVTTRIIHFFLSHIYTLLFISNCDLKVSTPITECKCFWMSIKVLIPIDYYIINAQKMYSFHKLFTEHQINQWLKLTLNITSVLSAFRNFVSTHRWPFSLSKKTSKKDMVQNHLIFDWLLKTRKMKW